MACAAALDSVSPEVDTRALRAYLNVVETCTGQLYSSYHDFKVLLSKCTLKTEEMLQVSFKGLGRFQWLCTLRQADGCLAKIRDHCHGIDNTCNMTAFDMVNMEHTYHMMEFFREQRRRLTWQFLVQKHSGYASITNPFLVLRVHAHTLR